MILNRLLVLFLFQSFSETSYADDVFIQLSDGQIRGRTEVTITNTTFYSFQGIPFAEPPINELRFQAPLPVRPWNGTLDATAERNVCYQVYYDRGDESEDCLFVNVYTPKDPSLNASLPVMCYIYGGGFVGGSADSAVYGPHHLMDYDVIIVTFNYRVGPFGFFSTGDDVIPGNAGLKDQQLALKWIKSNIGSFGGDPEKVTIFGQSAGAASVAYHLLSPGSKGLFRAGICESGSFLSVWAYQRNQRAISFQTAGYIDPNFNSGNITSEEFLGFVSQLPAKTLDNASLTLVTNEERIDKHVQILQGFLYAPVVEHEHDGAFITKFMYETLNNGDINRVPLLIGYNSEESIYITDDAAQLKVFTQSVDANHTRLVPVNLNIKNNDSFYEVGEIIKNLYSPDTDFEDNPRRLIDYMTDQSFARSVIKHSEMQSIYTDVYFYKFSYHGVMGGYTNESVNGFSDDVRHSEELRYIFRLNAPGFINTTDISKFPAEDILVHKRILRMWTDFAKYSNPTPEEIELLENITWPKVDSDSFQYLDIGSYSLIREDARDDMYGEWEDIYESYKKPPLATY